MVEIRLFARLGSREHVSTRARPGETLLDVADRLGVPIGQSCGGVGVCASCRVRVLRGMERLTEVTSMERKDRSLDLDGGWRLACQALAASPDDDAPDSAAEPAADPSADPADPAVRPADDDPEQVHLWHPAWGLPLPDGADGADP